MADPGTGPRLVVVAGVVAERLADRGEIRRGFRGGWRAGAAGTRSPKRRGAVGPACPPARGGRSLARSGAGWSRPGRPSYGRRPRPRRLGRGRPRPARHSGPDAHRPRSGRGASAASSPGRSAVPGPRQAPPRTPHPPAPTRPGPRDRGAPPRAARPARGPSRAGPGAARRCRSPRRRRPPTCPRGRSLAIASRRPGCGPARGWTRRPSCGSNRGGSVMASTGPGPSPSLCPFEVQRDRSSPGGGTRWPVPAAERRSLTRPRAPSPAGERVGVARPSGRGRSRGLSLGDMIVSRADRPSSSACSGGSHQGHRGGDSVAENVMATPVERTSHAEENTLFAILVALSFSHLLNDMIQSLIPAMYPILKESFRLSFSQIGLITLTFQLTASLLQPVVGLYTDRYPKPYSLAIGMGFTLVGLLLLSVAAQLPHDPRRRGAGGDGVVGLPPGVLPDGTRRLGGAAWPGAVALPGRRECGVGDRAVAGRVHRRPQGAGEHRLVLDRRHPGHHRALPRGALVSGASLEAGRRVRRAGVAAGAGRPCRVAGSSSASAS